MTELESLVGKQKRVVSISNHVTVRDAAKAMAEANVGAAAIMDGLKLVGLFTERDVLKRVLLRNLDVDEVLVRDVMTRELICAELKHTTNDARFLLKRHHIRHLPVLDAKGNLAGVLSIRDLIKDEVREMRDYIAQAEG